jgi:4-hydroxy-2-oxoheptanedioate aldolase
MFDSGSGFICLERRGIESYPSLDKAVLFFEVPDLKSAIAAIGKDRLVQSEPTWAVLHDPEGHNIALAPENALSCLTYPAVTLRENFTYHSPAPSPHTVHSSIRLQGGRMPDPALSGSEFKKQLRAGSPKMGLFLNAHSPTVAEQLAHSGYDWLLVDTQHGPMGYEKLSAMLSGIANGGAKSLVRVGGYADRPGIQQALDMGADGVLIPYINTAAEAREAISCAKYPTVGTRSVYFPQRSMDRAGLLGYAGTWNTEGIVALQVETASCIENIAEIAAVPGVDILFLGQNDLCMSMGLYNKYEFPHMYTSPELDAATKKLIEHARKNNVILGLFLFGTARVGEFLEKGFTFISIGNDLHHVLTQAGAYVGDMENIAKEKGKPWKRRTTALF